MAIRLRAGGTHRVWASPARCVGSDRDRLRRRRRRADLSRELSERHRCHARRGSAVGNPEDIALNPPTPMDSECRCEWWRIGFARRAFSILHDGRDAGKNDQRQSHARRAAFVADARASWRKSAAAEGSVSRIRRRAEAQRGDTRLLLHSAIAAAGILLLLSIVLAIGKRARGAVQLAVRPRRRSARVYLAKLFGSETAGSLTMGSLGVCDAPSALRANAIMLLSHYEHLVQQKARCGIWRTAIRGASERLVPILMTAAVTALGLLPGAQQRRGRMRDRRTDGGVILGGLVTSTALNLLVLPTLALRWAR